MRHPGRLAAVAVCAAIAGAACGKKSAPLAPFVRIPAAVTGIGATRLGNDIFVTVTVPSRNIDNSLPGDVGRIEVFGYTGRAAPLATRFTELGELVATIPVAPPPLPGEPAPPPPAPNAPLRIALQGVPVTILDTLTPNELVQGPMPPPDLRRPAFIGALGVPATGPLRRFYLAIPFSQRGRAGPPGTQAEIVLSAIPDPPTEVRATYTPTTVSLSWEPSGGLLGFLLDMLPPEPAPFVEPPPIGPAVAIVVAPPPDANVLPPGPTTYNVYRDVALDARELPAADTTAESDLPTTVVTPIPVNPIALRATTLADTLELGRVRCYTVRAVRGGVMSDPSPPMCINPVDVFPPAAPAGLAAVPSEGGISLIWEPNSDPDIGGYMVLRREAGGATLRLLTDTPITDARFRDSTVMPGVRYSYSVVAVDSQLPLPNVSAESAAVEETAR